MFKNSDYGKPVWEVKMKGKAVIKFFTRHTFDKFITDNKLNIGDHGTLFIGSRLVGCFTKWNY